MAWTWLRMVLAETDSSRPSSRVDSRVGSSRRTASSRSVKGSTSAARWSDADPSVFSVCSSSAGSTPGSVDCWTSLWAWSVSARAPGGSPWP
jgi:hypothetical protein